MKKQFLISISIFIFFLFAFSVNATWLSDYSGWSYKQAISTENNAANQTDYQVRLELNSSNTGSHFDWADNGDDIRFTYYNLTSNSEINSSFWIESWNSTAEVAVIWVNVLSLENNTNTTIYMYYGNNNADSESSINNTFIRIIDSIRASWHFDEGGNSTTDYFISNGGLECTTHDMHQQAAQHYNNVTYIAYIGPEADTYIMAYNHSNREWSDSVKVDDHRPENIADDHGGPSLLVDKDGYIHVVSTAHAYWLYHKKSTNPEDISSWETISPLEDIHTYPQLFENSSGAIYFFYRGNGDGGGHTEDWNYRTSSDGGENWSNATSVLHGNTVGAESEDINYGWYTNFIKGNNDTIHMSAVVVNENLTSDYNRVNIYYMYMDLNGTWRDANGTQIPMPLNKTYADQSNIINVYNSSTNCTNNARVDVDENNNPYIIFLTGPCNDGGGNYSHKFARWNGTSWEVGDIGAYAVNIFDSNALNVVSSGEIEAYLTTGTPKGLPAEEYLSELGGFGLVGGSIEKWVSGDGGIWSREKVIIADADVNGEQVVRNYNDDAKIVFSRYGAMDWYNDRVYLYGDSGFISNNIPVIIDSSGWGYDGILCDNISCHQQGPLWTTANCKYGQCLSFNGNTSHIYLDNEILYWDSETGGIYNLSDGDNYSITGWFYPEDDNGDSGYNEQTLIDLSGNGGWNVSIKWTEGNATSPHILRFIPCNDNQGCISVNSSDNSTPPDNWYHFVATQGDGTARLYINGEEVNESPVNHDGPGPVSIPYNCLTSGECYLQSRIGKDYVTEANNPANWSRLWFKGLMDEIQVYSKVLSEEEITDLYNNHGYTTTNYIKKVLVKKYILPEPIVYFGNEETPTEEKEEEEEEDSGGSSSSWIMHNLGDLVMNRTFFLDVNDYKEFRVNGTKYRIIVLNINNNSTGFKIDSLSKTINLNVNETKNIDLNNNVKYDIFIKLEQMLYGLAQIKIGPYTEKELEDKLVEEEINVTEEIIEEENITKPKEEKELKQNKEGNNIARLIIWGVLIIIIISGIIRLQTFIKRINKFK